VFPNTFGTNDYHSDQISLLLKSVAGEMEGVAVFGDCADYVVGDAIWYLGVDLQSHFQIYPDKTLFAH